MIDTHAHIDGTEFDFDRNEVILRALESGVEKIIIPGIEPRGFSNLLSIVAENRNLYSAIGIHPHHAKEVSEDDLKTVENLSKTNKNIAIGEIGLDYFYDFAPRDIQIEVFRKQLKIAKSSGLPVIVHNREADDDIVSVLSEEKDDTLTGVLHCFSSPNTVMEKAIELGFYISFTGNITFKKTNLVSVVAETPLNRILLETDSPYMTPVPHRGKRNDPSYLSLIAEKIAEIKSLTIDEVVSMTTENAKRLFKFAAFITIFCLSIGFSFAQSASEENAVADSSFNPFEKFIGFNGTIGVNTIVQTYNYTENGVNLKRDISYEGILFYGGGFAYSPFDFLLIKADYQYSLSAKKLANQNDPLNHIGEDVHYFYEVRTLWIPNPYSTINFFGSIGASYIFNDLDRGAVDVITDPAHPKSYENKYPTYGLNAGLGFIVNISLKNFGLLNLIAEWNLNFDMNPKKIDFIQGVKTDPKDPTKIIYISAPATLSTFYSMPRVSIVYYPPLKKWFGMK